MLQKKYTPRVFLALYGALMLWLLFFQSARIPNYGSPAYWQQIQSSLNLTPFHTINNYLHILLNPSYYQSKWSDAVFAFQTRQAIINLGGNIGMFLPLGILLPWVFPKLRKLWRTALATVVLISTVEILQLFSLLGSCDVDDLILNLVGTILGYGLWYALWKSKPPAKPGA